MPSRSAKLAVSLSPIPSPYTQCSRCLRRAFSSTPEKQQTPTRLRRQMFAWLNGPGAVFRQSATDSPSYLGQLLRTRKDRPENPQSTASDEQADENASKPFPLNSGFVSQSMLSEELRQEVWKRVQVEQKSVRQVSVELGIDMRRVGAVVRLVEVERRMKAEGKPLAIPYARAVQSMVPLTRYNAQRPSPHESINDLPEHRLTQPQLFYPTSESRAFNRVDAGRVFSAAPRLPDEQDIGQGGKPLTEIWQDTKIELVGKRGNEIPILKAADSRIPHPQLIAYENDRQDQTLDRDDVRERYARRFIEDAESREKMKKSKALREEANKARIEGSRFQFVVTDVQATRPGTGVDGRGTKSPGFRYGVPTRDRKRAQVKIPTKVEV